MPSENGLENILALTISMYTIEKKVVIPAINSVLTLVPRSLSLKNLSIIFSH